ncbi:MAG: hypothetical protein ACREC0_00530 [Methylocella sp.]
MSELEKLSETFDAVNSQAKIIEAPERSDVKCRERAFLAAFACVCNSLAPDLAIAKKGEYFPPLAEEALKTAGVVLKMTPPKKPWIKPGVKIPSGAEHQINEALKAIDGNPLWYRPYLCELSFATPGAGGITGFNFEPHSPVKYDGPTTWLLQALRRFYRLPAREVSLTSRRLCPNLIANPTR